MEELWHKSPGFDIPVLREWWSICCSYPSLFLFQISEIQASRFPTGDTMIICRLWKAILWSYIHRDLSAHGNALFVNDFCPPALSYTNWALQILLTGTEVCAPICWRKLNSQRMSSRLSCSKVLQFFALPLEKRHITISLYFSIFHVTSLPKRKKEFYSFASHSSEYTWKVHPKSVKIAYNICKVFRHAAKHKCAQTPISCIQNGESKIL